MGLDMTGFKTTTTERIAQARNGGTKLDYDYVFVIPSCAVSRGTEGDSSDLTTHPKSTALTYYGSLDGREQDPDQYTYHNIRILRVLQWCILWGWKVNKFKSRYNIAMTIQRRQRKFLESHSLV